MDTSLLNVDVQPTYVRCEIKGKVTQLHWPEEILVEKATIQRSTTTGFLVITAPVSNYEVILEKKAFYSQIKKEKADSEKLKQLEQQQEKGVQKKRELLDVYEPKTFANPSPQPEKPKEAFVPDFDIDEVPPLE